MTNFERKAIVENFCLAMQDYFNAGNIDYHEYIPTASHTKVVSIYLSEIKAGNSYRGARFLVIRSEIFEDYDKALENAIKNVKNWLKIQ